MIHHPSRNCQTPFSSLLPPLHYLPKPCIVTSLFNFFFSFGSQITKKYNLLSKDKNCPFFLLFLVNALLRVMAATRKGICGMNQNDFVICGPCIFCNQMRLQRSRVLHMVSAIMHAITRVRN